MRKMQPMDQNRLETLLAHLRLGKVRYLPRVGSTNDLAAEWLAQECPDLSLVVADEQTAGRGRSGRRWYTPPGAALAFSLILRAEGAPGVTMAEEMTRFSGLGALAVVEALRGEFGLPAMVKWPNDVLVKGRKVAGVLAEAHWIGEHLQGIVLGIGINIATQSVPQDVALNYPAASLAEFLPHTPDRWKVLQAVLSALLRLRRLVGQAQFISMWEDVLAFRGEKVVLVSRTGDENSVTGILLGLSESGGLRLRLPDGTQSVFGQGEVYLRPIDKTAK